MPKYEVENWGDIANTIFAEGVITAVNSEDDTADVTVAGYQDGSAIPLFYHCEPDSEEAANGSIGGAAAGFAVDDKVIVMCTAAGAPVRIVGFVDGIKECSTCYLLLCALSPGGLYYTVWDVVHECIADISWEGEEITFPGLYDLSGLPVGGEPSTDILYLWLMDRPWDEDVDEIDRIGLPAVVLQSALTIWRVDEPYTFGTTNPYSVPCRNLFGSSLGLVNTMAYSTEWYDGGATTTFNRAYGALNSPDWNNVYIGIGVYTTGPFASCVLFDRTFANELGSTQQSGGLSYIETQYAECHRVGDETSGYRSLTYDNSTTLLFRTPLGALNSIPFSASYEHLEPETGPSPGGGCSYFGDEWDITGWDAEWGGEPSLNTAYPKNEVLAFYSKNEKVVFQSYYYSAPIHSYVYYINPGWIDRYDPGPTTYYDVYSSVYEDALGSVQHLTGMTEDEKNSLLDDPVDGMELHEDFTVAIKDLFETARAASESEDPSIRHFDITVYN